MEHDECRPGTPVWLSTRAAIVVKAPIRYGTLTAVAICDGDSWRPSWVSSAALRPRVEEPPDCEIDAEVWALGSEATA